jgi:SAM-dependent methyltransferase
MDPAKRFTARSDVYARARPSYPTEVLELLRARFALAPGMVVADLGSGTGLFSRLLLDGGATVHAVEPNDDMRAEAERSFGAEPRFRSVAGRAEATTLAPRSVDLVTAAQAFHWFDVEATRRECVRILRPDVCGQVALVWNDRDLDGTPFLRDFEAILVEHCPGYRALQGKSDTPSIFDLFFGPGGWSRSTAPNEQRLDRAALVDRVMSASYAPTAGTDEHRALVSALGSSFDRHAEGDRVRIGYTSVVIGGRPRPA